MKNRTKFLFDALEEIVGQPCADCSFKLDVLSNVSYRGSDGSKIIVQGMQYPTVYFETLKELEKHRYGSLVIVEFGERSSDGMHWHKANLLCGKETELIAKAVFTGLSCDSSVE